MWLQDFDDFTKKNGFLLRHMAIRVYIMHRNLLELSNGRWKANECVRDLVNYLNQLEEEDKMTMHTTGGNDDNNNSISAYS